MSMVNKCTNGKVMSAEKQTIGNMIDLYNRYESVAIGTIAAAIINEPEISRRCSFISSLFDDWYKVKNKKEGW